MSLEQYNIVNKLQTQCILHVKSLKALIHLKINMKHTRILIPQHHIKNSC